MSNWVNYTYLGNQPNWPAGYDFAMQPALVVLRASWPCSACSAWSRCGRPWRAPLVAAAVLGVVSVTIAHASPLQSPLGAGDPGPARRPVRASCATSARPTRCCGCRCALGVRRGCRRAGARDAVPAARRRSPCPPRPWSRWLLGMAQPAVAMNLRTPGWDRVPAYWQRTADFLAERPTAPAWLVPGSGFALQTWGWTMDEPMQAVARTPWVSRSQVPLRPPQTIRVLSRLEEYLETGSGSASLRRDPGPARASASWWSGTTWTPAPPRPRRPTWSRSRSPGRAA